MSLKLKVIMSCIAIPEQKLMRILTNLITFITAEKRTPASGIKKKVPEKQIGSTCSIYSLINCQNNLKVRISVN